MDIIVEKHSKLHLVIFVTLSLLLFVFSPASFFDGFLAAMVCVGVFMHIGKIRFQYKRWYEGAMFLAVNAYLTLSFFGYDLFLANSLGLPRYLRFFYYALGFIWTSYVLQSALDMLETFCLSLNLDTATDASGQKYWKKWLILFAILCSVFMIWQLAYNPAITTSDSWQYLESLKSKYDIFRTPVYAYLIALIYRFAPTKPEIQWIACVQIVCFSSLLATVLMCFHKKWIRFRYVIPFAFLLPLIPSFGLYSIFIGTDLPCGMAMLWLAYVMVRIFDEMIIHDAASKKQQLSFCVQLCLSLVFSYFIRSNSFLVYIIMAPVLTCLFVFWKKWKLVVTVSLSLVIVLLIRFPGYSALDAQWKGIKAYSKYWGGMHDMQATYYGGGMFSEQTLTALHKYIPTIDGEIKEAFMPDFISYRELKLKGLETDEFLSMYIDSFVRNPVKMAKSILYRTWHYWAIDGKGDVRFVNYTIPLRSDRQYTALTGIMDGYVDHIEKSVSATFIWRFGVWIAFILVSMMRLFLKKRYIWLLAYLPVFTYLITLVLTNGWTDYRLGLSVLFIGMFLPFMMLILERSEQDMITRTEKKKENKGEGRKL